ncbi:hypothetical protein [Mangrovactinospora gilvigrisea]|uniref:hypothetical protein n=1 Tax=Mangrovactinospora gilvigrisea TaxID=1428644 RepID=UPI001114710C|nr:hypothetical protein [Mangrovactinospora gilvigrisea]
MIPLRPLRLGELLRAGFAVLGAHRRVLALVALPSALAGQLAYVGVGLLLRARLRHLAEPLRVLTDEGAGEDERGDAALRVARALPSLLGALGAAQLLVWLGALLIAAAGVHLAGRAVLGEPLAAREAWGAALRALPRLIGTNLLVVLAVLGIVAVGLLPLLLVSGGGVGPAPSIEVGIGGLAASGAVSAWLAVQWALAVPAVVLERPGTSAAGALGRSSALTRGAWPRSLAVCAVGGLVGAAAALTLHQAATAVADLAFPPALATGWPLAGNLLVSALGPALAAAIGGSLLAILLTLLYLDRRIRVEGLAAQLASAGRV